MTSKTNATPINTTANEAPPMYNEHTDYFAKADTEMNKALASLHSLKTIGFIAAPVWPVRDELVRHLLTLVIEYPWPDLRPERMDGDLYAFTQRNLWRLAILYGVPGYLAETAPYELMDDEMGDSQDYIGNLAKEVMDIAGNLSFVYGDLHALYV